MSDQRDPLDLDRILSDESVIEPSPRFSTLAMRAVHREVERTQASRRHRFHLPLVWVSAAALAVVSVITSRDVSDALMHAAGFEAGTAGWLSLSVPLCLAASWWTVSSGALGVAAGRRHVSGPSWRESPPSRP